jgi:tungstate transport system ATP-binding protein
MLNSLLPLRLKALSYKTDNHTLISDANLSLDSSGITVIVGQNGAGKSIFLRLLHGLLRPTRGEITWNSQPMSAKIRSRQSMVFQKPVLLRRSVAANIDFVLKMNDLWSVEDRMRILRMVGLEDYAKQPARLLSGGQQQRLMLARALSQQPDVIFLDEPTASLDPAASHQIESLLDNSVRLGVKLFLVTHDLPQARRLADDIIFIHQGRVVEHSPARQFFSPVTSSLTSPLTKAYLAGELIF